MTIQRLYATLALAAAALLVAGCGGGGEPMAETPPPGTPGPAPAMSVDLPEGHGIAEAGEHPRERGGDGGVALLDLVVEVVRRDPVVQNAGDDQRDEPRDPERQPGRQAALARPLVGERELDQQEAAVDVAELRRVGVLEALPVDAAPVHVMAGASRIHDDEPRRPGDAVTGAEQPGEVGLDRGLDHQLPERLAVGFFPGDHLVAPLLPDPAGQRLRIPLESPLVLLELVEAMVYGGRSLNEIKRGMTKVPQTLINVSIQEKIDVLALPEVQRAVAAVETRLGNNGRVLLRPSGTEPVVRVMIEGRDGAIVDELADELASEVEKAAKAAATGAAA